ncbi:hypothetical protein LWI29_017300 [Acer saccharum]|uniref:Integrase catalytic domain-containing protein n=1 Tax=Acer saccharum TaxID=4024 RepID=A0AA39SCM8_ACESA|nr:hypothetical protein LWI29_017300 [Acer saccharum]
MATISDMLQQQHEGTRSVADMMMSLEEIHMVGKVATVKTRQKVDDLPTRESCLEGKMTKRLFRTKGTRAIECLGLMHTDVCGLMSIQARDGYEYFITFTDDYSRFGYVYLMRHKSDAFDSFKAFKAKVEKQLEKHIKILRSDRGGEYLSREFQQYLIDNGIISQFYALGTPQ